MLTGIYSITCLCNNKIYIGQSVSIKNRWLKHKSLLRNNSHSNSILQRCYNKYGEDSLVFNIELICNIENLDFYEQLYLDWEFNNNDKLTMNFCPIAKSCRGVKKSKTTIEKMSIAKKNMTQETKDKISKALIGNKNSIGQFHGGMTNKKHTEETKLKMSQAALGKKKSEETKEKFRQINLGRKDSEQVKKNKSDAIKKWWAQRRGVSF